MAEVAVAREATSQPVLLSPPSTRTSHNYVFVSGALSGVIEGVTVQPLELLKTRLQIHPGRSHLQLLPTLREILREGGVRQLYRGGLPEIAGLMPRATAALSTLEYSKRQLRAWNGGQLSVAGSFCAGALSGVPEAVAFTPFQVIKVRLMAKEHLGRYKNTFDCLGQVVRREGVLALATGLSPTIVRNCVWNSLFYGTMLQLEQRLAPKDSQTAQAMRTLAMGTAVGMVATIFNSPFDVVKSRFQSQLPEARKYHGVLSTLAQIWREEGPRSLYKGFLPKSVRLGAGQSIGFLVFQNLLCLFGVEESAA